MPASPGPAVAVDLGGTKALVALAEGAVRPERIATAGTSDGAALLERIATAGVM